MRTQVACVEMQGDVTTIYASNKNEYIIFDFDWVWNENINHTKYIFYLLHGSLMNVYLSNDWFYI